MFKNTLKTITKYTRNTFLYIFIYSNNLKFKKTFGK